MVRVSGEIVLCECVVRARESFKRCRLGVMRKDKKSSDEKDAKYFGSKKINDKCFGNG